MKSIKLRMILGLFLLFTIFECYAITGNDQLSKLSDKEICANTPGCLAQDKLIDDKSSINSTEQIRSQLAFLKKSNVLIQLGGFWSQQGKTQHINIEDLIGDNFTVKSSGSNNGLFGIGYFIDGLQREKFDLSYGLDFFYLPTTSVSGYVVQENLYTNLAYQYNVVSYPLYAMARAIVKTPTPRINVILDVGLGPNFMQTNGFKEHAVADNTLADNIFTGRTNTTFSATVGASLRLKQVFGQLPLECGYRFFYLGKGRFNVSSSQVLNYLETGDGYANAIICAVNV